MMRTLFAALALLALAACGQNASTTSGGQSAEQPQQNTGPVLLGSTRNMPDWLLVARQRETCAEPPCAVGDIHFNQRTITRNADGTADIWIRVHHPTTQLFQVETERRETIIRYELERLHYRFKCDTGQFVVVERQFMGANETVVARDEPRQIYRSPVQGSVTGVIQPIACRGT